MDKPLIECSSEMSTYLGQSTEDNVPALQHPNSRTRYISFDNDSKKQKDRKEKWNSWTGKSSSHDSRHFDDSQTQRQSTGSSHSVQPMKLYCRSESGTTEIDVIDIPASHTSSFTSNATSEGVIDGEFVSSIQGTNEFEQVNDSLRYGINGPSTTKSLNFCKKHNIRHYNNLLKVIGWRKFRDRFDHTPCCLAILNVIFPIFIFLMLIFACFSQLAACFGRDTSLPPKLIGNTTYRILDCESHVVTKSISYLLLLMAYIGGFYIFRRSDSEHLSSLTETVFLSFNYASMKRSPAVVLMAFLICGLIWLIFSASVSVLRLFALDLDNTHTLIEWFVDKNNITGDNPIKENLQKHYEILHYFFVFSSLLGFVFFDLLYIAVTINFCSQCQLLTYYIENIIDKVQNKRYKSLHSACQEIYHVYEYLKVLNGKVSFLVSLIGLVFLGNLINSYINLRDTDYKYKRNIALGFLNIIQWLSITAFPLIVATRFTAAGRGLRRLGLQIAARPFVYRETSDLDLQYFLNFTEATRFTARIAFIPMYPAFVMGFLFVVVLLLTIGIVIPRIDSVPWF